MDQPTEEERLEFVKSYGVEPVTDINTDLTFKDAATTVAEMTPIIGDAMAAKEIYDELQKEDPDYRFIAVLGGAGLIGAIPGIGDVAAKGIRNAADMIKRIEVDPDALGSLGGNIRLKPKKSESFKLDDMYRDDFDWGKLNLKDSEVAELANVQKSYLEAGGGAKAVEAAEKRVQDAIDARIPAIEESLKDILKTSDKSVVSLDDYKNAVEATVRFDTVGEAAETISNQKGLLNKMGPGMMDDMLYDSQVVSAFEQLPDNETFQYILENGLDRSLVDWAVKEEAIRKSFNNYKKAANKTAAPTDVWAYPEQLYDSADTSINVSKKPAGYNELKKRGEIKDGDVIVDIGGGRFDNLVEDAAEEGATVKVYDPFNRTPEHNAAVVDSVKDGQADMAMSHNVLNVIQEDKNIIDIAVQAENAIKPNGKAHFSVYEGTGKGEGKVTTKGYQRNQKTQAYVPLIEQVFGEGNVTRKGKIITATKNVQGFSEGGMALEEQMAMNFGDVPDNTIGVDPVSGNEIPLGATAENVRDDIPANLSEGEIVVPTDVVNYHGVKLFEDLRAEAKMGYAQMAQDGRIGGEPMDDAAEDRMMDIELSELDLEVMDDEQGEAPVEMARGGMNVERGRGNIYSSYSAPKAKPTRDRSMAAVVSRAQANKNKPKNRFEAIKSRIRDIVSDDDRRVTLDKKPPTSDPIRPSIAQQINFGGDYKDKESPKPEPKKRRSSVQGAGDVAQAYRGETEPFSVRYYEQPFYQRLLTNLKRDLGFDEGGMATDENTNLIGGEDQFNQPFYDPNQMGGFDMENAYPDYGDGTGGGPLLEMREYMNDAGHRIFITFIDGVPQMEIPPGYYPVEGEGVAVAPEVPPVGGSGGSDMGDDGNAGGIPPELMPTPVNYKELTMEELSKMLEDQKSMTGNALAAGIGVLNPIIGGAVKLAMWNETRQLKNEIQRRRDDPATSEVDKRRYDQMLEVANAEEPGLIATLLGKLTGNDPNAPAVRTQDQTDALYNQLDKMTKAYTPSDQEASDRTSRGFTPGVDDAISVARPAATTTPAIPEQSTDADAFDKMQDRFDIERIEADMKAQPRPAPKTADKPIRQESDRVQKARQNTQKVMKDMRDRGASREERTQSLKAAARTENVLRDLDRGVVRGFEKGGLVDKPTVKKVVKGLKKASKSHAKQADQLEKAMKKKSK